MPKKSDNPAIRVLPDDVANKIAAGEVVERPASVVKELLENALDAGATRIIVRVVAAGRRLVEVTDNGHGMSEQNALLSIERHATSKIRTADDLDEIHTMGFRGEALASIASVSHFELVTRREKDEHATRLRVDGGTLREVEQTGAPVGTRISVNRLYFNTPVRAKFLKGITTELGHCMDIVQRHALARLGVGFQFFHNDKQLLDIPEHASLRDRVALIWGVSFVKDMVEIEGEKNGFRLKGIVGLPSLNRAARSHQLFYMNTRPVVNRSLQYGMEDGYQSLITIGRHPVGVIFIETSPLDVDVNIHPTKREVRFKDERVVREAVRDIVRMQLATIPSRQHIENATAQSQRVIDETAIKAQPQPQTIQTPETEPRGNDAVTTENIAPSPPPHKPKASPTTNQVDTRPDASYKDYEEAAAEVLPVSQNPPTGLPRTQSLPGMGAPEQDDLPGMPSMVPDAVYQPIGALQDATMQLFDTYLLVPDEERLLIIDQHALHERLNYDSLIQELQDVGYASQQLAVPLIIEVAPSQVKLLESNLKLLHRLGIDLESFGGNTFQVIAICHLYDENNVSDFVYALLHELEQGNLFNQEDVMADMLRLATRACKASVRGGDRLTQQERQGLLEGFKRLRPPYTCPHGRPIIVELTQNQMEKSFRRIQ